ncbi:MAG: hypothetical protein ACXAC6_04190 [Candidatus Hodarchaeales archaeon]|jgi:hypothetical protein
MELQSAYGIELSSFIDLIRLISSSSPERPSTVFKWTGDAELFYYGSFAIFPGYFDYKGLPVMFYITSKASLEDNGQSIVRYDLQQATHQITFLSFLREKDLENTQTGLVRFIPIINLKTPPHIFSSMS